MIRSLIGYQGSKFNLLNQLLPLFPKEINNFYDLFGGSASVTLNVNANKLIYNDINLDLKIFFEYIYSTPLDILQKNFCDKGIRFNSIPYNELRAKFNQEKDPLMFLFLIKRAFGCLVRYNQKGEFNSPRGRDFATSTSSLFKDLSKFKKSISKLNLEFYSKDFSDFRNFKEKDFVYLDPPYFLNPTGYSSLLNKNFEEDFYKYITYLIENNVNFGMSNLLQDHKGNKYKRLENFIEDYNLNYKILDYSYSRNNTKNKEGIDNEKEVYIFNYDLKENQEEFGLFNLIQNIS